ncbi:hypothetical protein [Burkholderia vietnamiensis]|uniref:hypothetical protein n=1 Tax=Burkholderia vietnamiensis TaxID=60552 RepID=UPI001CF25220|nr:hypothetical protein [Burkholderia vietnamiensis]MCA8270375.1 hypothetical protein [Burkholderia vietnamiensis]
MQGHTTISEADFVQGARDAVLEALDVYMRNVTGCLMAVGWRDSDLPELFTGIDAHMGRVAARFRAQDSTEAGAVNFSIEP